MHGDPPERDYDRMLGVIEAITAVRDQCPNAAVRGVAERALDAIKARNPGVLREQAFIVLSAMMGWRGDRARQVHRSLSHFLETSE
jgi:hypothetical protein